MKRFSRILLLMVILAALTLSGCTYDPPEGYTEKHHTYEEVLAYAKTLDPNATVSEEYTDTTIDDWDRSFREWPAVINGIECHVSSVGDMIFNGGFAAGEFARQYFYIDTDYDYLLLEEIVKEKQPDWSMKSDDISSRYNWNHILVVQTSYSNERQLTDEELETAWQEALEIHEEYSKYPVRKQDRFDVPAPNKFYSYATEEWSIQMSSLSMRDFNEKSKDEFLKKYHERWALTDSDLSAKD
jgi:hypothetical protein